MILPYQRHLEWLILESQPEEQIQKFYYNIQYPKIPKKALELAAERVSKLILPPAVRRNLLRGIFRMEDNGVWDKLGYGEVHARRCVQTPSKDWEILGKVLNHPVMRLSLECCLIAKFDEEKIVQTFPQVYSLNLSYGALDLFKRYFCDISRMERGDWIAYLGIIKDDPYTYQRVYTALTKPLDELLFLLGLPTQKQYTDFLKNVLAASNYKFQFYARQNTPESDAEARRWAKVGFEAGEKFEKYGASDITDFAKLVQTEFEYVTPEVPTITPEMLQAVLPKVEEVSKENKKVAAPVDHNHPSFRDNESV